MNITLDLTVRDYDLICNALDKACDFLCENISRYSEDEEYVVDCGNYINDFMIISGKIKTKLREGSILDTVEG